MTVKQVIVVRADLKMRRGKEAAQVSHASMAFLTRRLSSNPFDDVNTQTIELSDVELTWLDSSFTKIVLAVDSEEELLDLHNEALESGVVSHLVEDNGTTEFHGVVTPTCIALGPDHANRIDAITSHLRLR